MYENTGTRAHVMAAELIDAGVDVQGVYRRLYEGIPFAKLELLGRGLANVERYDDGRLSLTRLSAADYEETGADESFSEGVVDHLRAVEGTAVAGLVRDRLGPGQEGRRKVSLRASDDRVDVSAIARSHGGGGHRQAAGFTTDRVGRARGCAASRARSAAGPRVGVAMNRRRFVVAAAFIVAALVALPSLHGSMGVDPWGWAVWGRELVHGHLDTTLGPALEAAARCRFRAAIAVRPRGPQYLARDRTSHRWWLSSSATGWGAVWLNPWPEW